MFRDNKDLEAFSKQYQNEEKEILVLTSDQSGGGAKFYNSWNSTQYFLAYIDLETNVLKNGDGRINWLVSEKEYDKRGIFFPYYFKGGTIYHLKVRELIDKTVPEGRLPSAYNSFMVVEVLNENVQNETLLHTLKEYREPVNIMDKQLGKFELNKDYGSLTGELDWLDNTISVFLEIDVENKESWKEAIEILRILFDQQKQIDLEFRTYAGEELTDLANDWLEDEENEEITKNDFLKRLSLSELVVTFKGDYTAYYDDDDMFYGHVIVVSGNIKTGISSANIAG